MKNFKAVAKNFWLVASGVLSILGCVLGAGFLSGAEIYSFFVRFGYYGVVGAMVCSAIFGFLIYLICRNNHNKGAIFSLQKNSNKTNEELNIKTAKIDDYKCKNGAKLAKTSKFYNFSIGLDNSKFVMPVCQIIIAATMVAGANSVLKDFGLPQILAAIIIFAVLFVFLVLGIKFARGVNIAVSVASLIFIFCLVASKNITILNAFGGVYQANFANGIIGIALACLYAIMNIISSYTIIDAATKQQYNIGKKIAAISGLMLGGLVLTVFVIINSCGASGDMPLLNLFTNCWVKKIYCVLLIVAMISTMLSCGLGGKKLVDSKLGKISASFVTVWLIEIISLIGFANLVNYGYPLIGTIMIINVVVKRVKKRKMLQFKM